MSRPAPEPAASALAELLGLALILAVYAAAITILPVGWLRLLLPSLVLLAGGLLWARRFGAELLRLRGGARAPLVGGVALLLSAVLLAIGAGTSKAAGALDGHRVLEDAALVLLVPAAEELYFRGLLLGHLLRTSGRAVAPLVASAVFGILHLPQGRPVAISLAALSLALCAAAQLSRGLLWSIGLHSSWNAAALLRRAGGGEWLGLLGAELALWIGLLVRGLATREPA